MTFIRHTVFLLGGGGCLWCPSDVTELETNVPICFHNDFVIIRRCLCLMWTRVLWMTSSGSWWRQHAGWWRQRMKNSEFSWGDGCFHWFLETSDTSRQTCLVSVNLPASVGEDNPEVQPPDGTSSRWSAGLFKLINRYFGKHVTNCLRLPPECFQR